MPSATGCRLTMKFNFGQKLRFCGWSESYDMAFVDLTSAAAGKAFIEAFVRDRCNCLGRGPTIISAVVSAYAQPFPNAGSRQTRRSTIEIAIPNTPAGGGAYYDAFNSTDPLLVNKYVADFGPTCYYISCQTSINTVPVYRRNMWLPGLPDIADETDDTRIVDPVTNAPVQKFLLDLNNSGTTNASKCGISIRSVDRSAGNPVKQCTSYNNLLPSFVVPNHGFVLNQPIIAEGWRAPLGGTAPRGRYLVSAVIDADNIQLMNSKAVSAGTTVGGFRGATFTFNTIQFAEGQGFTKRNKGRPGGLSVGKRPIQRTSRA